MSDKLRTPDDARRDPRPGDRLQRGVDRLGVPEQHARGMEETAVSDPRDTAPQPPPAEPCDDCRQEPCVCPQQTPEERAALEADYQQWIYARGEKDRRIAALEAELAEAQERLAMAVEALKASKATIYGEHGKPALLGNGHNARYNCNFIAKWHADPICKVEETAKESGALLLQVHQMTVAMVKEIDAALTATAPAVAEFVAGIERRGAAKELRGFANAIRDYNRAKGGMDDRSIAEWIDNRADELEGK